MNLSKNPRAELLLARRIAHAATQIWVDAPDVVHQWIETGSPCFYYEAMKVAAAAAPSWVRLSVEPTSTCFHAPTWWAARAVYEAVVFHAPPGCEHLPKVECSRAAQALIHAMGALAVYGERITPGPLGADHFAEWAARQAAEGVIKGWRDQLISGDRWIAARQLEVAP